jgi:hypothetical protein
MTLGGLSAATGISVSTLSRLESGGRRATLELLVPVTRVLGLGLDDLVGTGPAAPPDPRVRREPMVRGDQVIVPLSVRAPRRRPTTTPFLPATGRSICAPTPATSGSTCSKAGSVWLSGRPRS